MSVKEIIFDQEKYVKNLVGKNAKVKKDVFANTLIAYEYGNEQDNNSYTVPCLKVPAGAIGRLMGVFKEDPNSRGYDWIGIVNFNNGDPFDYWNYKSYTLWIKLEDLEIISGGGKAPL